MPLPNRDVPFGFEGVTCPSHFVEIRVRILCLKKMMLMLQSMNSELACSVAVSVRLYLAVYNIIGNLIGVTSTPRTAIISCK